MTGYLTIKCRTCESSTIQVTQSDDETILLHCCHRGNCMERFMNGERKRPVPMVKKKLKSVSAMPRSRKPRAK